MVKQNIKDKKEKGEKKIIRAIKNSAKEKIPDFLKINDIQILMPLEATLMRSDLNKIQLSVLLSIIEKLAYKLRETIEKRKIIQEGQQLVLFKDEEWSVNSKNEKIFRLKLLYKEVGVQRNHYDQLESSLTALSGLPISIPYKDKEGKDYTLFTNFCDVLIPKNQTRNIYCLVDFKEEVANSLLKVDFGYHYVGKKASKFFGNCSKYCERIYWLIQGYQNVGSVRVTTEEFRKRFGLEKSYKNFSSIRSGILEVSASEIKRVFLLGGCECWFEYREIFKGGKTKGEPYEIEFVIHKEDSENKIDNQLALEESVGRDKFQAILKEDLHLASKYVSGVAKRLTDDNCQQAISKALTIKAYIEGRHVDNPVAYAIKSLNEFFETYKAPVQNIESRSEDGSILWNKFIDDMCNASSADVVRDVISQIVFISFDDKAQPKKKLNIMVPNESVLNNLKNNYGKLVVRLIKKHFGTGVDLQCKFKETEE